MKNLERLKNNGNSMRKTKYDSMNHDTVLGDEQVVTGVKALNKTTN
jgi:hypothetical protein